MTYARFITPRNLTLLSLVSLGSGYFIIKSKTLTEKQRAAGDYSVSVDRSGEHHCLLVPFPTTTKSLHQVQLSHSIFANPFSGFRDRC
ncbi:hypothetical protein IQ07DRAFT_591636 [Pyrenochaeta sp. DS3sAY3a]|nr:hypothetical protein IQ07DRAFT_591636 [Pyrenochaeta sp. DS3sAY3a]